MALELEVILFTPVDDLGLFYAEHFTMKMPNKHSEHFALIEMLSDANVLDSILSSVILCCHDNIKVE